VVQLCLAQQLSELLLIDGNGPYESAYGSYLNVVFDPRIILRYPPDELDPFQFSKFYETVSRKDAKENAHRECPVLL